MPGSLQVRIEDVGTWRERLVVEDADDEVLATPELAIQLLEGSPHVKIVDRVAKFGTAGEGLGVVAYEIGPFPPAVDAATPEHLRPLAEYVTLRRVA